MVSKRISDRRLIQLLINDNALSIRTQFVFENRLGYLWPNKQARILSVRARSLKHLQAMQMHRFCFFTI